MPGQTPGMLKGGPGGELPDFGSIGQIVAIVVAVLVVLWAVSRCIRMVQQTDAWIIEFLGTYRATWKAGLHFKIPFVEKIVKRVSLKENVVDFEPQTVITARQRHRADRHGGLLPGRRPASKYAYGVNNPMAAIENLTATTLRNVIGDLELDQTLTSRDEHQLPHEHRARRGHRRLGHQGQPRRAQGHHAPAGDPPGHGEADEGRARAPRGHPAGRGREAVGRSWSPRARSSPPSCAPRPTSRPRSSPPRPRRRLRFSPQRARRRRSCRCRRPRPRASR